MNVTVISEKPASPPPVKIVLELNVLEAQAIQGLLFGEKWSGVARLLGDASSEVMNNMLYRLRDTMQAAGIPCVGYEISS